MKTNFKRIHKNSTSSAIVLDKSDLAAPRGKQETDEGVGVKFSGRSIPVGVQLSECEIVSNIAALLYPLFKNYFRSAVFLLCSARGEFWMKPFLSCVLTSAVCCPVLVQQTVPFGGLSSGAVWRRGNELISRWVSEMWDFRGLPEVVKPSDLEHLEKLLCRIIIPSTFHDNVSSAFEFLSLGCNDPRMWTGT